jgi:hypothetical protein
MAAATNTEQQQQRQQQQQQQQQLDTLYSISAPCIHAHVHVRHLGFTCLHQSVCFHCMHF